MRNWVFNRRYIEMFRQVQTYPPVFELVIKSRRPQLGIREGDKYLLLGEQKPHGFRFKEYGEVKDIAIPEDLPFSPSEITENERRKALGIPLLAPMRKHTIQISPEKQLGPLNRFDDLIYSLLTVKNYARPMVHFQRQYRELVNKDFETIINGWVYVSRTAFGKLGNALPNDIKLQFMLIVMEEFKTMDFTSLKYDKVFDSLKDYLEGYVLSQGRLLIEIERMLREDLGDLDIPVAEIGFYDDESKKADLVQPQAKLFQELFAVDPENTLIQEIKTGIKKNKHEERFYNMFKERTWPLFI